MPDSGPPDDEEPSAAAAGGAHGAYQSSGNRLSPCALLGLLGDADRHSLDKGLNLRSDGLAVLEAIHEPRG